MIQHEVSHGTYDLQTKDASFKGCQQTQPEREEGAQIWNACMATLSVTLHLKTAWEDGTLYGHPHAARHSLLIATEFDPLPGVQGLDLQRHFL